MEHLVIEQGVNSSDREDVSMALIQKLYDVAKNSTLDNESDVQGRIRTTVGYREPIDWLRNRFPNLTIEVSDYAIAFEDENMLAYLLSLGIGSNGMITESQAAAVTIIATAPNTVVRKFNELKYFTSITESRGGLNSGSSGWVRFYNWTALEEIDISNFTSLGHDGPYAYEDTFRNCTSLKRVTASNKLKHIGYYSFSNCSNLEEITGLSGVITVYQSAFGNNQKLKNTVFDDVEILFGSGRNEYAFEGTKLITTLVLSQSNTLIPNGSFYQSNIATINIPPGVLSIGERAFYGCGNLRSITLPAGLQTIGPAAFNGSGLESLTIPNNVTTLPAYEMCKGCSSLITVNLPSSIDTLTTTAFQNCSNLETINIGSVVVFEANCLDGCRKAVIQQLSSNITKLGFGCFSNCYMLNIEHLNLPLLTEIGSGAFSQCHIDHIDNLGTVTSLGEAGVSHGPFDRCGVKTAVIPATVNYIARRTFYQCSGLQWVKMLPTTPPDHYDTSVFESCNSTFIIYVPDASLSAYQNDSYWGQFNIAALSTFPTN